MKRVRLVSCVVSCLALLAAACSESDGSSASGAEDGGAQGSDGGAGPRVRPEGPSADLSQELTEGGGPIIGSATGLAVPEGYVQHEYVASGTATSYAAQGELTNDGVWTFEPGDSTAEYRTRILVRHPEDPSKASGTIIVEWLNVSGGIDANPEYSTFEEEVTRKGHTWVGVSAQRIGIEGGPVLVKAPGAEDLVGKGLKTIDPERYGSLSHPGDGYAFDIYSQVARAVLGGATLDGIEPRILLAAGESQSAIALTTYYNGVQPLTELFDGFYVHSRAAVSLPLVEPGQSADLAGAIGSTTKPVFRGDLAAPILDLQAESDLTGVLSSSVVRQPDTDRFRLWEVAGTAHADAHLLGSIADQIDCGLPINAGPLHVVGKAALRQLEEWVREGKEPVTAPRIDLTEAPVAVSRNEDGIALGGIRTPPVDVPVEVLSGVAGPSSDLLCILLGSTKPLSEARIAELYSSRSDYEDRYAAATDATIEAGFVLEDDREALMGFSKPSLVAP